MSSNNELITRLNGSCLSRSGRYRELCFILFSCNLIRFNGTRFLILIFRAVLRHEGFASIDLSDYFYKTDVLTYSLTTQGIIEISLKDSILTIKGLSEGSTVIRITDGNMSVRTINVTVE